jgi:hypothetical protein
MCTKQCAESVLQIQRTAGAKLNLVRVQGMQRREAAEEVSRGGSCRIIMGQGWYLREGHSAYSSGNGS